ncbi:MAG: hypothetical protein J0H42_10380 [Rhizobiales bacterium]|nr:hypothetical protein [Hyphomicrobiales bacterium]
MISTPTVFVLGAGASEPYGLPLGYQLRLNILEKYNSDTGHTAHLTNTTPFVRKAINQFVEALKYSGLSSVDAFLERRPEFMDIGKAMMGIELLHGENHERLWQNDRNWLTYLYGNMIGSSLEEFADNQVSFVTFNYDRCVEHFLFISLQNAFGRTTDETAAVVSRIPIVHLHGRLGHLSWQNGGSAVDFGDSQIDARKMGIVMKEIKVVHEELTDGRDKDFAQAKELLAKAKRVYLAGFGFGSRNVQRLGLDSIAPEAYQGTAYGLTGKEIGGCAAMCGGQIRLNNFQTLDLMRQIVEFS